MCHIELKFLVIFVIHTSWYFMKKSEATRQTILQKAFELIYVKGYQATSVDDVIATLQVTKGAFFYHFKNKEEMGLAVINELMFPIMHQAFVQPLTKTLDPVMDIYALMKNLLFDITELKVEYGCPAANLTQEMSPLNADFGIALSTLVSEWKEALMACVRNGKKSGTIRNDVDELQVAYFVMAGYWGIRNFGKLYKSTDCYVAYLKELKVYLRSLE